MRYDPVAAAAFYDDDGERASSRFENGSAEPDALNAGDHTLRVVERT